MTFHGDRAPYYKWWEAQKQVYKANANKNIPKSIMRELQASARRLRPEPNDFKCIVMALDLDTEFLMSKINASFGKQRHNRIKHCARANDYDSKGKRMIESAVADLMQGLTDINFNYMGVKHG